VIQSGRTSQQLPCHGRIKRIPWRADRDSGDDSCAVTDDLNVCSENLFWARPADGLAIGAVTPKSLDVAVLTKDGSCCNQEGRGEEKIGVLADIFRAAQR
jgi:hypothetical protein